MSCQKCGNYTLVRPLGGSCHRVCVSCGESVVVSEPLIHEHKKGKVQKNEASTQLGKDSEMTRMLESLSYDNTLQSISDVTCPKCQSQARVWINKNSLYSYLCPKCHIILSDV